MKTKNNYSVTVALKDGGVSTAEIQAYGIMWIPNEVEKTMQVNCPYDGEIIKIEKL